MAADEERLADHLGLDRFAVSGTSGGGPFVLATAWSLDGRVTRVAISCGLGPLDQPGSYGMTRAQAEELKVARDHPERLERFLEGVDVAASMPGEPGFAGQSLSIR